MYLSLASNVTKSDFEQLNNVTLQNRVEIIYLYLVGDTEGHKYNFNDIASISGKSTGQAYSSICRCYNIGDKTHRGNSGIYSCNSSFCKKYQYEVSKNDILEFVSKYPNGCYPDNNLEDFLIKRIELKRISIEKNEERKREIEEENRKTQQKIIAKQQKVEEEAKLAYKWFYDCRNSYKVLKKGDKLQENAIINFGKFCQSNEEQIANNPKGISWIVLDIKDDKVLLLSDYILKTIAFDDNYEKNKVLKLNECSIYKWLNEHFYYLAFNQEEKNNIISNTVKNDLNLRALQSSFIDKVKIGIQKDTFDEFEQKVFILSYDELKKYSGINHNNLLTDFTNYCNFDSNNTPAYWTRTASKSNDGYLVIVAMTGVVVGAEQINNNIPYYVYTSSVGIKSYPRPNDDRMVGVRPAVWVKKDYIVRILSNV